MSERNSHSMLAVSVMAGLAGAGLALLFAPRSGRETRARIKSTAADLRDKAEDKFSTGKEKARHLKERIATTVKKDETDETSEDNQKADSVTGRKSPVLSAWREEL